jgi:hypothetical protein
MGNSPGRRSFLREGSGKAVLEARGKGQKGKRERTKNSFKSKELGDLRKKLEGLLKTLS